MEKDERLLPLPKTNDLQISNTDGPVNYSPVYDEDNFDERRSIREYFNVVYKRLPLILALTILVTAAAAFYMYRQPSQYQATMEMIIEPRKPKPQANQPININFGNDVNYYNTQLQLLQSPDLMRDAVVRLGLYKDPNLLNNENKGIGLFFRSLFSSEKTAPPKESSMPLLAVDSNQTDEAQPQVTLTAEEKALSERYAGTLSGGMKVEQREKTNIVTISITSTNPDLAAKVANMVGVAFIEQDAQREMRGAKQTYEELSKSIEELQTTIANQEVELINYMRNGNLPLQDKGSELRAANLQTLSGQWLAAMDDRRKLEARYNAAVQASNRGEGINIPDITDNKVYLDMNRLNIERRNKLQDRLREIDKEIQEAEAEKAELLVKYTPEFPKVKQTEEKIASLTATRQSTEKEVTETINRDDQKLNSEAVKGALVGLKSQLDAARTREEQLHASYMNQVSTANGEGVAETQLTTLKRKIETNRGLLDTYTQRQKEQELAISGSRPDNIKIATGALTPTQPVGPKRERNIFIAFLISLAAGIGLAFLLDYLDDSVKSSDDIGRHLGLPTLALIPHQTVSTRSKLGLLPAKTNGNAANTTALIALEDTRSAMAEAYRHLRTSLLFSSAGKPPQTILVTSSQPAEGKTTTAINTAITLAQSGADVVIIDCDLRRPRLHNHFGFGNANGLTNYLSGEKNPDNLLKPFPELPKLKVITSGPIPPNPAELLSSNEMKNLLQFLKTNYKHVIIDSPPAISFTDAAILSTQVDGVVLVAMAGKSSIHLIRRFKQRLSNIGARIYGVVLNGIKSNSVEYGYYGYGYTYYTPDEDDLTPFMDEVETASSTHTTKS
ncbi:MAG TPA: polysaccharide biosynthesis tyrosine autokinase [Pyrinomonadaceae bacterium]|jgi:capsular exopolysaccharide synthesis family protein